MNIEEAIKLLNRIDIKNFLTVSIEQSNYIIDEANKVNNAIEIVLNELDKKDKQIKELSGRCKNLDREAQSYLEELAGDSGLKDRIIKIQDKVIDMMAEYIEELTGSCPNDIYDWKEIDCENICNDPMKQCWIKYFYNKVK